MDIVVHKNISVRMRDGVMLATDVYRPNTDEQLPALIARTPYNKEQSDILLLLAPDPLRLAQTGYAVVIQDCRGCFQSEGQLQPLFAEADDGVDTIAWVTAQPWSNGVVGMVGGSYLGAAQWLAAARQPAALQALAPFITSDQFHEAWFYQGGAFQLGFALFWALGYFALPNMQRHLHNRQVSFHDLGKTLRAQEQLEALYWHLPLNDLPQLRMAAPFYFDWLAHPDFDAYWKPITVSQHYQQITAAALHIGGWYDPFLAGTLQSYSGIQRNGGSSAARQPGLLIGPWSHGNWHGRFAERDFGPLAASSAIDIDGTQLRWFDYWLKGAPDAGDKELPVTIFVMGRDYWREEADWPLPDTIYDHWYLRSGGNANTLNGDGMLSRKAPGSESPDCYVYDPRDPVPTCGGATLLPGAQAAVNAGPRDQRGLEMRPDVLVYSSPPLEHDLEVTGPVTLVLYVASSAYDTDFAGKLVDVYPDGRALILTDGILRARYRNSRSQPELLEPDRIYELQIDLVATANVFRAGHCIRLEVSSSNFPRFDRNSNTGGIIATEGEADLLPATNWVFHDAEHPSHLILPIIERE